MKPRWGKAGWTLAVAVPVMVALTGCARGAVWRASDQMCIAHGGQYSHETKECTFAARTTVSGEKACQDLAGVYMPIEQRCRFDE